MKELLNSSDTPTLVAIRLRQLGDVLATLGTLRAIKRAAPARRTAFVVDGHYHELLRDADYIDLLVPEPPRFSGVVGAARYAKYVETLRELRPECVLDFHSNTRSAILSFLAGAPVRVGFDVRLRKVLYTDVEPRTALAGERPVSRTSHEAAMALARRAGIALFEDTVEKTLTPTTGSIEAGFRALAAAGIDEVELTSRNVIGLNPGKPYPAKAWPDSYFIELARGLTRRGKSVLMLWGPGERVRAERLVAHGGDGVTLAPSVELAMVPGMLRHLGAVVTIDSGLKHIAVAVGVPTVTLFGPTSPDEWHMGGPRDRYLFAGLTCSPCRRRDCPFGRPCMTRITPADVLAAVSEIESRVDATCSSRESL